MSFQKKNVFPDSPDHENPVCTEFKDNCIQNFQLTILWSEILFYDDAPVEPCRTICNHKTDLTPLK